MSLMKDRTELAAITIAVGWIVLALTVLSDDLGWRWALILAGLTLAAVLWIGWRLGLKAQRWWRRRRNRLWRRVHRIGEIRI
jgi:O-antigen/teichoic acid export membrane protein